MYQATGLPSGLPGFRKVSHLFQVYIPRVGTFLQGIIIFGKRICCMTQALFFSAFKIIVGQIDPSVAAQFVNPEIASRKNFRCGAPDLPEARFVKLPNEFPEEGFVEFERFHRIGPNTGDAPFFAIG